MTVQELRDWLDQFEGTAPVAISGWAALVAGSGEDERLFVFPEEGDDEF